MSTEIGSVYANALFSLAQEQGDAVLRQTRQDLRQCAVLFSLYPDFGRLLSLPTLSLNTRCDIAQKAFGSEDPVSRLLLLLIDHNRIPYVGEIADAFDARMLDYERTAEVLVTTAVPMTPDQLERLSQKLSAKFQKTIRIKERIDRSMIGGVIVQYGDTRIDNSLKLRLEALRTQLQG